MTKKIIYSILIILCFSGLSFGQERIYSHQNKILGSLNPSFYGFNQTPLAGAIYGSQKIQNNDSNIASSFAFATVPFEEYNFSLALDLNLFKIESLGYSASQINLHYIYNTNLTRNWKLNTSFSAGYGNNKLDFNSLLFGDQIDVLTGDISAFSIDPVNANDNVSYFDFGVGAHAHNSENMYFGFNLKHLNQPDISFNSENNDQKELFLSLQGAYEMDINRYQQGFLPENSFLLFHNSISKQAKKFRADFYQEAILDNFSIGINQHINNYEDVSLTTFGVAASIFIEQMEIGANYTFEMSSKQLTGVAYNYFELFIVFDFYRSSQDRRGNNSRFFNFY
jgi:type IX secretion system PorP/SprF family membrane protein